MAVAEAEAAAAGAARPCIGVAVAVLLKKQLLLLELELLELLKLLELLELLHVLQLQELLLLLHGVGRRLRRQRRRLTWMHPRLDTRLGVRAKHPLRELDSIRLGELGRSPLAAAVSRTQRFGAQPPTKSGRIGAQPFEGVGRDVHLGEFIEQHRLIGGGRVGCRLPPQTRLGEDGGGQGAHSVEGGRGGRVDAIGTARLAP